MKHCLELAAQARRNGYTAVGSIIVKNGKIIAEGKEGDPDLPALISHAENVAIEKAVQKLDSRDLSKCSLYTTVEPCFMCTYLIRQTQIKKVVYGTTTPAGGDSSAHPILTSKKIDVWKTAPEVIGGVLKTECEALLRR